MPTYKYRAKKDPENTVEGRIDAASEKEAIEKISLMGYLPVQLEVVGFSNQSSPIAQSKSLGRIRSSEITLFSRQLASLLRAGVPILKAINIISEQIENPSFKAVLSQLQTDVKEGATFSASLSRFPRVFSALYIAMIRIGENSGGLSEMLLRISEYRVKQEEMFSRLRMAMAYPILMAIVGVGTVLFMFMYVMPRLMSIYASMEQQLPVPTKILIYITDGLHKWWYGIVLVVIAAIFVARQQAKTSVGRISMSIISLRLPLFGKFILKAELARFSRTLELLIKSGIPILRALEISIPVLNNEIIKQSLHKSYKELEQGGSFGRSLRDTAMFPLFMSNLIRVGEESGKLSDALGELASSYERDTDESIRVMSSLIEPVMILGMGLIVGFIVISMLLPIFEINVMVK